MRRKLLPLFVSLAVLVLGTWSASACLGQFSESSIFFNEQDLTAGVDGPVVAHVKIIALPSRYVAVARVNKIIKGSIDRETIIVTVNPATACTRGFGIGASGIVVGSLKSDDQGELVLTAAEESNSMRTARWKAHSLK
jgi:hypothetical protein